MTKPVKVAKIFMTEADKLLNAVMSYLHFEAKLHGVTVTKAYAGFGESGAVHSQDSPLAGNLPLILEFYDEAQKVDEAIAHVKTMLGEGHVITWQANME